jgi:transposase InsO family protein
VIVVVMASEVRLMIKIVSAVIAQAEGAEVNVAEVCRQAGVSRQYFYNQLDRYRAGGVEAMGPRSRRPHRSPNQTSAATEDEIVRLRKQLDDDGLDHGATTIQWHLGRNPDIGHVPVPSTIHRILVARGLVTAQPRKRPKAACKRFEAAAPNERWQIDATDWTIATGVVAIFNIEDDHSRVAVRSRAVAHATTDQAWTTFGQAAQQFGLPSAVLSDNGLCFSGKLHGFEVVFEARLRDAGVAPITGRPYHPQTTGKVERFQQTLKKWLRKQPLAADLDELQTQLDEFCYIYNQQRPHQGIGRQIPIERFAATTAAGPAPGPLEHPHYHSTVMRTANVVAPGVINIGDWVIHLGARHTGHTARVVLDDHHATVFINDQLIRHLQLDHTRRYQPSGNKRGGPHQPRLRS